jgi:hypothetical protein
MMTNKRIPNGHKSMTNYKVNAHKHNSNYTPQRKLEQVHTKYNKKLHNLKLWKHEMNKTMIHKVVFRISVD